VAESVIRLSVVNDASPKLRVVDRDAKKLSNTVKNTNGKLNDQSKSLKHAALGFLGMGGAAKSATPAIHGAGAALKGALAPILPLIAAGAALQQVFATLVKQDFGEAKYESLGGSADNLVNRLKLVSSELNNSISVTELTAASYDVASAGFIKAADAAQVLKAASQGATGGFADLNTTGNALTSVLNAYGASASESSKIMDQFIQTQNDGKIVVAEYAANIGKVASVAATLNVPLAEVNAIIAQSTAAGVKAEVAFTGLKVSMLKLVSSRGQKKLKEFGVDISAATIEAEGLAANLEKLQGLGTQALTDIFGAEAIQVMAPILKDMERYRELVESQKAADGVAARAAFTASDTLQGQIKRLGVAFQNMFADGSEMGEFLKLTLYGINGTVELLGVAIKTVVFPFRLLANLAQGFFEGLGIQAGPSGPIQKLTEGWFVFLKAVDVGFEKVKAFTVKLGKGMGAVAQTIVEPMKKAMNWILKKVDEFWNLLPGWMKWGIKQVTGFAGGVANMTIEGIKDFATAPTDPNGTTSEKKKNEKDSTNELKKQVNETNKLNEAFGYVGQTISQNLAQGIKGLIKGTQSLSEMLGNIALKISDMLLDLAISSAFKNLGFPGFAAGGRPPIGKPAIVGEKGPELFVPRQSGTIIPNNQLGGGGSVNVSVNVDASGSSAEGNTSQAEQLGNMLGQAIQAELVRQKRPGGLLAV
tara:strand:+ start:436 stop:2544 length:2109 start_codon:yes stop_codon:yes gene_type:complete